MANAIALEYGFWLGDAFASGGSKRLRPQGARHHRARRLGERQAALPRARPRRRLAAVHASSGSATCRATCSATACCSRARSSWSPRSTTATSSSIRTRMRRPRSPSARRLFDARRGHVVGRLRPRTSSRRAAACGRAREKSIAAARPRRGPALGVDAERARPRTSWCSAILRAPVDLLWNGGIGTFVKSSEETNAEVGDRDNDAMRVDGRELRARVVGEGGNLGLTQRGPDRVRDRRRPHQHGCDRQLGRRRLLGPRGQHQDPARRWRRARAVHARGARHAARLGRRRGLRARALRQLPAGADPQPGAGDGGAAGRGARDADARAGARGAARPPARGAARRATTWRSGSARDVA